MEKVITENSIDLWEAWIDMLSPSKNNAYTLYVIGEVYVGDSHAEPVMIKKKVQGADDGHLYLEILPCIAATDGHIVEIRYAEGIDALGQYNKISICLGEDIITTISDIEVLY